jgi:two-component system chemotaxis response regulator CheB
MPDIVAIGTSTGGLNVLKELAASLPPDFGGSILIVQHTGPAVPSLLPEILSNCGPLPAIQAADGARIEPGYIYTAPPDRHLRVAHGHMHVTTGPKENFARPSINPLLRSAGLAYGSNAVGVILSGELDDGVSGLWDLKRRGGTTIVQDPEEAASPSMPRNAIQHVQVDYIVRSAELAPLLTALAGTAAPSPQTQNPEVVPTLTDLTCPECRGTLWEDRKGTLVEYRCRVGHVFTEQHMVTEHNGAQERALYAAIVALEEGAALARHFAERGGEDRDRLLAEAEEKDRNAAILRRVVTENS